MELLVAIMVYFNLFTYQQVNMTPVQVNQLIQANQPTVEYYQDNMDLLRAEQKHMTQNIPRWEW